MRRITATFWFGVQISEISVVQPAPPRKQIPLDNYLMRSLLVNVTLGFPYLKTPRACVHFLLAERQWQGSGLLGKSQRKTLHILVHHLGGKHCGKVCMYKANAVYMSSMEARWVTVGHHSRRSWVWMVPWSFLHVFSPGNQVSTHSLQTWNLSWWGIGINNYQSTSSMAN